MSTTKTRPAGETVSRTVTLPLRGVLVPEGGSVLDVLRPAWRLATDLANWAQLELVKRDTRRTPAMTRLPKYDREKMYGTVASTRARKGKDGSRLSAGSEMTADLVAVWARECPADLKAEWEGGVAVARQIIRNVEETWKSHPSFGRFAVLWKGEARPAVFQYPYSFPVAGRVHLFRDKENRPRASLPLPGGRVEFRLGDRHDFRRQLAQFDVLIADPKRIGAVKVTGRWTAGKLVGADLRIPGKFDATPKNADGPAAVVRTDPNALLVVEVEGRPAWVLNADHAGALVSQLLFVKEKHRVYLQRTAEDLKYEKRLNRDQRKGLNESRARRCDKAQNRVDSLLHQITAQVAGYCKRVGVSAVVYDDSVKSFVPNGFPWHQMRERIAYKVADAGAEWIGERDETTNGGG